MIIAGFFGFSIILGVIMVFTGDAKDIPFMLGGTAIIGLSGLFFLSLAYNKSPEDQQKLDADYFVSLIEFSKENPKRFQKEYKGLIGHGLRYIVLLFILIILSLAGIIAFGVAGEGDTGYFAVFAAGLAAVLYTIIKSLYIKSVPLAGYEITAVSSPEIIKTVERARFKTISPPIDKIIVMASAGCGVSENILGFGRKRENVLFIGVYLLMMLTPDELEAIYIHEFSHIYRKDTHVSNKINSAIARWSNILNNLQSRGIIANTLLKRFAEHYITKMQFYYTADSKSRETLADKDAAETVGKEAYARASLKIEFIEYYFSLTSEKSNFDFRVLETPPENALDMLMESFVREFEQNKTKWKEQILKRISNKIETHPSYSERMAEVGVESFDFDVSYKISALPETRKIIDDFNADWQKEMEEKWEEYTASYKKSKELVRGFEFSEDNEKNIEYAMALEDLSRGEEALEIYGKILEKDKDHAPAAFRSGLIYLSREDERGIEFVKAALEADSDFIDAGLQAISAFLNRNGLKDKKEEMEKWALEKSGIYDKKTDEAENLYLSDVLEEAEISEDKRRELKAGLEDIPEIKTVLIATKKLKYSKHDLLVVGAVLKRKASALLGAGAKTVVTDEIWRVLNTLDAHCFLLMLNARFLKSMLLVKNSKLIAR